MNRQCPSITQKGNRYTGAVPEGKYHCWFHDPANTDKRRRIASKGKKSQLSKNLHVLLEDLTERVINGDLKPYPASVAGQLTGVRLRRPDHEHEIRETELLEVRIEELEAVLERQDGRRQWTG